MRKLKDNLLSFLALFTSFSTLLCCALPALLVSLGLGAALASAVSAFPFLISLTRHKHWLFLIAFIAIVFNSYLIYSKKNAANCPVNTDTPQTPCETASNFNKIILWISIVLFSTGLSFAYLIPLLL